MAVIRMMPVLHDFLSAQATLTDVVGTRIYAHTSPPPGYRPDDSAGGDGPALVFNPRGGSIDYTGVLHRPSIQFRGFGNTPDLAWQVVEALFEVLDSAKSKYILAADLETIPYLLRDPDTDWPFTLCFYQISFHDRRD